MSTLTRQDRDPASPFKFLDPYELADKEVFFGRDREVETLYRMVYQTDLLLVYGYSGTGKTSLIRCGLAGRFDGPQWYPFFIRKGKNISRSTRNALLAALENEAPADYTLVDIVEEIADEYLCPVYLIFDQFEELFILGSEEERRREQDEFIGHIQTLLAADFPCKILFVIREEYLGELYRFEQALPQLFDFKLRVESMNNLRVRAVLRSSFDAFNIDLEAPAEDRIDEIIRNVGGEKNLIQLPYLQVYLDTLWREDFTRSYPDGPPTLPLGKSYPSLEFTAQEIEDFGAIEEVLPLFLSRQEERVQRQLAQVYPTAAPQREHIRDLLEAFVTQEGTKLPLPFHLENDQIIFSFAVQETLILKNPVLSDVLHALEARRILRAREGHYELAHDSLAALVAEQQSEEKKRHNRIRQEIRVLYQAREFLSRKRLDTYAEDIPKMELEPELRKFVENSRAVVETAELKDRRRRGFLIAAILIVAMIMAIAAIISNQYRLDAQKQEAEAIQARDSAQSLNLQLAEQKNNLEKISNENIRLAKSAQDSAYYARQQEQNAQNALGNLETYATEAMPLLLANIKDLILHLKYEEALTQCKTAWNLNARQMEVARLFQEIAFFFTESGAHDKALATLDYIKQEPEQLIGTFAQQREDLLRAVAKIDPGYLKDSLKTRYYPYMIDIAGGSFCMGRDPRERGICDTNKYAQVEISAFRLSRTEVTVWQYNIYCLASGQDALERIQNNLGWTLQGNYPVVNVSWYEAGLYANWITQRLLPDRDTVYDIIWLPDEIEFRSEINYKAKGARLPTDAEWEYAARGGGGNKRNHTLYSGSNNLDSVAWNSSNSQGRTHVVGTKKANGLGLYDMSGNVWEWCQDRWTNEITPGTFHDPIGPLSGDDRVLRGGAWYDVYTWFYVVTDRNSYNPVRRYYNTGFRLAQGR